MKVAECQLDIEETEEDKPEHKNSHVVCAFFEFSASRAYEGACCYVRSYPICLVPDGSFKNLYQICWK